MDDRRFDDLTRLAATTSRRGLLKALVGAAGGGLLTLVGARSAAARSCFAGGPDCAGCCEKQFCRPGTTREECGKDGGACQRCAEDEECRNGTCMEKEACNAATCPDGCCPSLLNSFIFSGCQPGTDRLQCGGPGGTTCRWCDRDELCLNRTCVECGAETCRGCCDRERETGVRCEPGTTPERCGTRGSDCQTCATGERCEGGQCVACNAGNCPGCCTPEGQCEPGDSPRACGAGGRPCASCPSDQVCINGECKPCNAETCPAGCCSGGSCVTPPTDGACGLGGVACAPCGEGSACVEGRCRCDPARCAAKNGCCDDLFCWDGDTSGRCGSGGAPCDICDTKGATCVNRVCRCDPELCDFAFDGCCAGDRCESGDTDQFCGRGGRDCVACGPGESCRERRCVCDPARCAGCCQGGACKDGDSILACGRGGGICAICAPDQLCRDGQCVSCRANCDGCCDGQFCRPGTERTACGKGGAPCEICDYETTERCIDQMCQATCGAANCPDGCCLLGDCVGGTSDIACGTAGQPCQHCRQRGQTCRNQACTGGDKSAQGCGSETCDTCCDGEVCVETTGDAACGTGGGECQNCAAAGGRCADGACVCDQSSCPAGCCAGNACQDGDEDTACGRNGEGCEDCTEAGGRCVNQMCAAPGDTGSCPDGCTDPGGSCQEGTSPDACGPPGGTCQACQDGEQCEGGSCVRRVGSRPTTRPDFAYAVVRPTDLPEDEAARAVVGTGFFYDGTEAGFATGSLTDEWVAAFGGTPVGPGFRQSIGLPAGGETPGGWDWTITTWSQYFDGSEVNLPGQVVPNLFAGPLADTTPLQSDPTIGDGAYFHGSSGQTSEGVPYLSAIGVYSFGPVLGSVRVNNYTGAAPDVGQVQDLTRTIVDRGLEIWAAEYRNLGTDATLPPFGDDPRQWAFNGSYYAVDSSLFRPGGQDAAAFARDQERFSAIDRRFNAVQPLSVWEDEEGPRFAYYATSIDQFVSAEAAQAHFGQLDAYLAEDGAAEGFTAVRQPEAPAFPNIITPPDAILWQYRRQSEQGDQPGAQVATLFGDRIVKVNARGFFTISPGGQPTAEYQAAIDEVALAGAIEHLAGAFDEEIPPVLGSAVGRFVDVQRACLSGEPQRCVESGPVVTTGDEPADGTTARTKSFDLAAAVITPVDIANAFGVNQESIQTEPGLTFTGIENAAVAGFTWLEEIAPRIGLTAALGGHRVTLLSKGYSRFIEQVFQHPEDETLALLGGAVEFYFDGSEVPSNLDLGDEARLFEASGESATGSPFYSQLAAVRQGNLVGLLQVDVDTGVESDPEIADAWLWDPSRAATTSDPITDPADVPLVQTFAARLAEVQAPDYQDLGPSFPNYSGPNLDPTLPFADVLNSVDLSSYSVYQESYTVVDNQTIRQAALTDEQHALHVEWNANVEREYQRVETLLSGASAVFGSDATTSNGAGMPVLTLGRAARRYTSDSAAAEGFANLEQKISAAAALDPNVQVVPDLESGSPQFGGGSKWFRIGRWDGPSQLAGVELVVNRGDWHVVFDAFSTVRIAAEDAFSESHVQMLYRVNQAAAIDYFDRNDLDLDLSDEERALLGSALKVDLSNYSSYFASGSVTVPGSPIVEAPEGSGPSAAGCPPGWTYDADGPLGDGCYRCSYPCLEGSAYDARQHLCVRNGQRVNCTPKYQPA